MLCFALCAERGRARAARLSCRRHERRSAGPAAAACSLRETRLTRARRVRRRRVRRRHERSSPYSSRSCREFERRSLYRGRVFSGCKSQRHLRQLQLLVSRPPEQIASSHNSSRPPTCRAPSRQSAGSGEPDRVNCRAYPRLGLVELHRHSAQFAGFGEAADADADPRDPRRRRPSE